MAHSTFNLDGQAFSVPTHGVMQPCTIQMLQVEEEDAVDNPQIFQPAPEAPEEERREQAAAPNTQDMDSVMALADDLQTFREWEGYRFPLVYPDTDISDHNPEEYSSEDESSEEIGMDAHAE